MSLSKSNLSITQGEEMHNNKMIENNILVCRLSLENLHQIFGDEEAKLLASAKKDEEKLADVRANLQFVFQLKEKTEYLSASAGGHHER